MNTATKIETWVDAKTVSEKAHSFSMLMQDNEKKFSDAMQKYYSLRTEILRIGFGFRSAGYWMARDIAMTPMFRTHANELHSEAKRFMRTCAASSDGKVLMSADALQTLDAMHADAIERSLLILKGECEHLERTRDDLLKMKETEAGKEKAETPWPGSAYVLMRNEQETSWPVVAGACAAAVIVLFIALLFGLAP